MMWLLVYILFIIIRIRILSKWKWFVMRYWNLCHWTSAIKWYNLYLCCTKNKHSKILWRCCYTYFLYVLFLVQHKWYFIIYQWHKCQYHKISKQTIFILVILCWCSYHYALNATIPFISSLGDGFGGRSAMNIWWISNV